jgi:hypothetical protein
MFEEQRGPVVESVKKVVESARKRVAAKRAARKTKKR